MSYAPALRIKIIIMQPCESAKMRAGKRRVRWEEEEKWGGGCHLQSQMLVRQLLPETWNASFPTKLDPSKTKKTKKTGRKKSGSKEALPACYTSGFISYNKQQYEMGIRLVLRIIFAVVWSSQLTSGSLLPFELPHCLYNQSLHGLEMVRWPPPMCWDPLVCSMKTDQYC